MTVEVMLALVKQNLKITGTDNDLMIKDHINNALIYCNLSDIPDQLEPYIRKKTKAVIDYEALAGTQSVFDVKSQTEGESSWSYNVSDDYNKVTIYGLSEKDKKELRPFRRLRR